tara:strand:+ start:1402 stop:2064 length:663 start_codon:yes stop_codon:yes gene_type:complete
MQQREFLERARKALIKHGIIGSRAKALLEEWNDHLESEVEKLVAGGQDRESSYQDACKALGEPESLVDSAAKQLAMESWQGRNPVLSSGILSVVVFLLGIFAMVAGGFLLKANFDYLSPEMLKHLITLIDTLPWLLCLGWLAYHARKMPLGWKGLWFVAAFTAILPSFLGFTCDSPNRTMTVFMAFLPIGSISKFIITFGLTLFFWWFQTRGKNWKMKVT